MRLLTAQCPYCGSPTEATMDKLSEPVDCPHCHRPFEIEIPKVQVSKVEELADEVAETSSRRVTEPGERVLIKTHSAVFRAHPVRVLIALLLLGLGVYGVIASWSSSNAYILWGTAACAAAGAVLLLVWWIQALTTTLTVTDRRTILRRGILSRTTSEVEHDDVRNIQMDQSLWERIFHVGDIGISSAGQDNLEILARAIPHPNTLVKTIRENQT